MQLIMANKRTIRVIILGLILLVVLGLFLFKNSLTPAGQRGLAEGVDPVFAGSEFDLDATDNFDLDAILAYNLPVIVDFGADSCAPCKEMAPVLAELNQELRGKAIIKFVDVWKNPAAGQAIPLQVIPTQFFFNADGTPYVPADIDAAARQGFVLYERQDSGEHVYTAHQGGLDKESMLAILAELGMK